MTASQAMMVVARAPGADFLVEQGHVDPPGPGQVLVEIAGVGICHTDLIARDQLAPFPLPAVLGHEGAGTVKAVGAGVSTVTVGDHVVLSFASCGQCRNCRNDRPGYCTEFYRLNFSGECASGCGALHDAKGEVLTGQFFGQSSFASHALASERCLVRVDRDVPLDILGPLGCGFQTGAGAVLNSLQPQKGSSLAIFGAGSVGLAALLAARVAECGTIILVDRLAPRLELARELGATHVIDASKQDPVEAIRAITGGGADYTLECTGVPAVLRMAVDALAIPGVCGVVGAAPFGAEVALDVNSLVAGRTVRGIIEGDAVPQRFIPELIALWREGRFPFDRLVRNYPMADVNRAVADMHAGNTVKAILVPRG